jgi:mono/diheme cytochrome c family protein
MKWRLLLKETLIHKVYIMKKFGLLIVLVLLFLTACGSNSSSSDSTPLAPATVPPEYAGKTNPLDASAATEGADVFKANCVACHGEQGKGDGIASGSLDPKPANLGEVVKQVGDDYLFWRISEGKPGTSMVAWKGVLEEEQIWQVITFIHTLNKQ